MIDERDQLAQLQDKMYHDMIEIPDDLEQEIIDKRPTTRHELVAIL